MKINTNTYYFYIKNLSKKTKKQKIKQGILSLIKEIYHQNNGTPGYRQMKFELKKHKIILSSNTVYKYMKELEISSITRRKYKYLKGEAHVVFADLLKQNFTVSRPNMVWCCDFTYLHLENGEKHYNCSILDLYDRSIVSSICSSNIDSKLAIKTLQKALIQENYPKNIVFHTDQGSQFASKVFTVLCKEHNIIQSMSRAGVPYDNSPMERFFNTLKCEFYYLFQWRNKNTLYTLINNFIYKSYNHSRPHSFNGALLLSKKDILH